MYFVGALLRGEWRFFGVEKHKVIWVHLSRMDIFWFLCSVGHAVEGPRTPMAMLGGFHLV